MSKRTHKKREFESNEEREEYYLEKRQIRIFYKNLNKYILTARFNNSTLNENRNYLKKIGSTGCIYGSPDLISLSIPIDSIMFILEMNNDENKISGIGMVKNHPIMGKHVIYSNGNYNRYVYLGKYRIDRTEMKGVEIEVMQAFDILCFTGKSHMKRCQGIKQFPVEMIYRCLDVINLVDFITNMFKNRFSKSEKEKIIEKKENIGEKEIK